MGGGSLSTSVIPLQQLERRDPEELMADEDEDVDMEDAEDDEDDDAEDDESSSSSSSAGEEEEEEEADEEADLELRRKIEEALRVNGISAATGDSDDESEEDLMDDDQMLAIDDKLAAAFKARAAEKGTRKGKYSSIGFPVSGPSAYTAYRRRCAEGGDAL